MSEKPPVLGRSQAIVPRSIGGHAALSIASPAGCEMTTVPSAARRGHQKRARPGWHYVYFLLAGFNLITVALGFYLGRETTLVFTRSIAVNQVWVDRGTKYSQLGELAQTVNAPGNDVFDTQDIAGGRQAVSSALAVFNASLNAARAH